MRGESSSGCGCGQAGMEHFLDPGDCMTLVEIPSCGLRAQVAGTILGFDDNRGVGDHVWVSVLTPKSSLFAALSRRHR